MENHSWIIQPMAGPQENPHDRPHICTCEKCGKIACAPTRQAAAKRHWTLHGNRCRGYTLEELQEQQERIADPEYLAIGRYR